MATKTDIKDLYRKFTLADPFWSNLFRRKSQDEDLYTLVRQNPVFADVGRREFRHIESLLHRRGFALGEAIVSQGEPGSGMYIILEGQVEVSQQGEDGASIALAHFGPGDFFGEQALLDDSPRTATARTTSPCQVVGFFRSDLLELIQRNPRLGLKIALGLAQSVARRLRHATAMLQKNREQSEGLKPPTSQVGEPSD